MFVTLVGKSCACLEEVRGSLEPELKKKRMVVPGQGGPRDLRRHWDGSALSFSDVSSKELPSMLERH